ncbi:hypothetical protein OROMI_027011 [Orobanche minor]
MTGYFRDVGSRSFDLETVVSFQRGSLGTASAFLRRTIRLKAKLVDIVLETGKIYDGAGFNYIKESFETNNLHLIGLLSDDGVHSRLDQLQLLLKGASERGAKKIRVHILTDGRDVPDGSSVGFVETLEKDLADLRGKGIDAQIAFGGGRMYVTMDRYEAQGSNAPKKSANKNANQEADDENLEDFVDPETPFGEKKRLSNQMSKHYSPAAVEKS